MNQKPKQNSWQEVVSLLHYNEKTESYKKLTVSIAEDGGVMLSLSEGKKGDKDSTVKVNFSLNRQELIYLAKELELLFMKGKGGKT
ncbi:hypothetical protein IAE16_05205 [Hydrogenobacter sp. T-2]|uniref:hypothetical protein n=1 Tax=Pampinifervens diazotrophicum TaxID=1632018 RepID=UPI002B26448A|nr:hypothetical protein [Hydrogenobacter sp. T-2]WPM31224.1 hypothetical protein IAE16_05205 [Hydrogenobacter sp. T-2]